MSDQLKKFVSKHRKEFDTNEPNKDLWGKIDAQMNVKTGSRISSNSLSKFKYLGFSASVLVVAIYFFTKNPTSASENGIALDSNDSVMSLPKQDHTGELNRVGLNAKESNSGKEIADVSLNKNQTSSESYGEEAPSSFNTRDQLTAAAQGSFLNIQQDSVLTDHLRPEGSALSLSEDVAKLSTKSPGENKETTIAKKSKKAEIHIPEDPKEMNTYTGTLYEGISLCSVLQAYKFPGKVNMNDGRRRGAENYKRVLSTTSCNHLDNMTSLKAVWLKGKTDKEMTLSIKKRFKNMVLVKRDGRKLNPEAISHYYPGLGVISEYRGKYLNMVFKDKVELILFFKDVQEGDKIVIDGNIQAVVKNSPY